MPTAPSVHEQMDDLERRTQERGRALLAATRPQRLITLTPAWWQERLMEWAMADAEFRVKLLRFVDVLPALRSPGAVAEHVRQYFRDDARLPVRLGSDLAGVKQFRPVLSRAVRQGVFSMAERFIGGANPEDALPRLRRLNAEGVSYTVDLLGEAILSEAEADAYLERYLALIRVLGQASVPADPVRKANVSVKLSALTSHFEAAAPQQTTDAVLRRLNPLLAAARAAGVFVNVDMEQHRFKDLVHTVFAAALLQPEFRDWPDAGIVVQAYTRDAASDLDRLHTLARQRGTPITVRLVKGAYWDEETVLAAQDERQSPVFTRKSATDANYERCTNQLLALSPHLRPAFGSHNPRSIAHAMAAAEAAGLPPSAIEFQMLYGMAEGLRHAVAGEGYLTRVYVPVGEIVPGMAYLVRRLLENTSNESWLLHRHEEGDPELLLAVPEPEPDVVDVTVAAAFTNHTPAQFHEPATRSEMAAALTAARASFGRTVPLWIGGEAVTTPVTAEVRAPGDPALLLGSVAQASEADVQRAVAAATRAFPAWRETAAGERAGLLRRAASLIAERRFAFAAQMVFESGKPWREADGDVCEAIDYLRYYAAEAERLAPGVPLASPPGEQNKYTYEPRGVVAVIAPWNFPLAILTGMASAALASGCTVILKPAEQSPLIAAMLSDALHEAGLPPGTANYLPGPGEVVGASLVNHPAVDVIAFTGSNAVGLAIMREAAVIRAGQRNVKRVVAEMGGKNAIIVDDDADLDAAVEGAVASAFGYAGQKCSAASRVIVVGSAYEAFRDRLAAAVESLVVGPPEDPYAFVPPVISAQAKTRIDDSIARAVSAGRLVARASVPPGPGHYVAPHVVEDVPAEHAVARDEVFGPLLLLFRAPDFRAALALALDSPFALTGGVYSRHPGHIALARREFRVGNLYLNRKITGAAVGRQPFGGMAMSGAGDKAGGPDYLLNFLVPRVVTENTMRRGFADQ